MRKVFNVILTLIVAVVFTANTLVVTALDKEKFFIRVNNTELNLASENVFLKTSYDAKEIYIVAQTSEEGVVINYEPVVALQEKKTVVTVSFEKGGETVDYHITIIKADMGKEDLAKKQEKRVEKIKSNAIIFAFYLIVFIVLYSAFYIIRIIAKAIIKLVKKSFK